MNNIYKYSLGKLVLALSESQFAEGTLLKLLSVEDYLRFLGWRFRRYCMEKRT